MTTPTVDELRSLGDPKVNEYLEKQAKLGKDMDLYELVHMAESFGRPGSMTFGGNKFKKASSELRATTLEFILYCIVKGYVTPEDYAPMFKD